MKCVRKQDEYRRVSDQIALDLVTTKGWTYSSKCAYKAAVRNGKPVPAPVAEVAIPEPTAPKAKKAKKETK